MTGPSRRSAVPPFHAMEVLREAAARSRAGQDVLPLCVGQPASPAPRVVLRVAHEALDGELLGYTEAMGLPALRQAVAGHYGRTYGADVDPAAVCITTGSSGGFVALLLAAFDPGDVVATTRPGYPAYRNTLRALGLDVLEVRCGADEGYRLTAAMLDDLPRPPAGLVLASPANPTGTVVGPAELAAIARWCAEHDCLLISDEIYHGLSYGPECASAWESSTQAVVLGSVSKHWAMTGWRLGWMLLPEPLRTPVEVLSANLSICPPALAQHAALACFTPEAVAEADGLRRRYAVARELLVQRLPRLGITSFAPPDGAFYAWCDVSGLTDDAQAWCARVLADTGVALTPGIDFDTVDGHRFVRISFAGGPQQVEQALDRLERYVDAGA